MRLRIFGNEIVFGRCAAKFDIRNADRLVPPDIFIGKECMQRENSQIIFCYLAVKYNFVKINGCGCTAVICFVRYLNIRDDDGFFCNGDNHGCCSALCVSVKGDRKGSSRLAGSYSLDSDIQSIAVSHYSDYVFVARCPCD